MIKKSSVVLVLTICIILIIIEDERNSYDIKEDIIEKCIGSMGKWQLAVTVAVSLVKVPVAWFQLGIIFLAPPVAFQCSDATLDKCDINCSIHIFNR